MIKITDKPIEVKDALEGSSSLSAGAINVFVGNIRVRPQVERGCYGLSMKPLNRWR